MKKTNFDFKDLQGALSRDEMKSIKGGDVIHCTDCTGVDPNVCWSKYCTSPNCWIHQDGENTYLCQCIGGCGG
jgi:hypothetical protein